MKRVLPIAFTLSAVLLLGVAPPAAAALPDGTPVVVVGQISSPPRGAINEQKMQVAVGYSRSDYTLHFRDAVVKGPYGERWDEDPLDEGQWVRAEGYVMDDPRRIKVTRMRVISEQEMSSIQGTPYYRAGAPYGYLTYLTSGPTVVRSRVAGTRYYYRYRRSPY
jgi:hypothetical protein